MCRTKAILKGRPLVWGISLPHEDSERRDDVVHWLHTVIIEHGGVDLLGCIFCIELALLQPVLRVVLTAGAAHGPPAPGAWVAGGSEQLLVTP